MLISYKDLIVWQKSFILSKKIYQATTTFPKSEIYGLVAQMRRNGVSIPSNIAEGYARGHRQEYVQFLRTAFASGAELETQLLLAKELKFLTEKDFAELNNLLTEVMKMLNKMINNLQHPKS
ncbi:MAG: four helix bundle protein [Patescibacteria group bacterium]